MLSEEKKKFQPSFQDISSRYTWASTGPIFLRSSSVKYKTWHLIVKHDTLVVTLKNAKKAMPAWSLQF